jgi:hypothetical protein
MSELTQDHLVCERVLGLLLLQVALPNHQQLGDLLEKFCFYLLSFDIALQSLIKELDQHK